MVILTQDKEIIDGNVLYKVDKSTIVGEYAIWIKWINAGEGKAIAKYKTKTEATAALMALFEDFKEGARWSVVK